MSNKGQFSKTNQPVNRKGKLERTKVLEALARKGETEEGFYDLLVEKAFAPKDSFAFGEILKRLYPLPKQVAPVIHFELNEAAKPHEQALQIMNSISNGEIPPDIGNSLITSIKNTIEIEEYTDLKERIEKLERLLHAE